MAYTQEELTQLDEYISLSNGAAVSLYAKKGDADPIFALFSLQVLPMMV